MAKEKKKQNTAQEAGAEETKAKESDSTEATDKEEKVTEKKEKKNDTNEEKLQKQLDEKNDQLLRIAAEYDNFRKRTQREKEALFTDCKTSIIKDILPVVDNFDRVFANPDVSYEDYKKGVEMTFKQFADAFKKLGVEAYGEVGENFDPNLHNAVMHTEDENANENVITNVLAKGYKLGDKIIRPAMVAVTN